MAQHPPGSTLRIVGLVLGAAAWIAVPVLGPRYPFVVDVAVVVPLLLLLGLVELHSRYGAALDAVGALGRSYVAVGLLAGFTALLTNALYPDGLVRLLVVGLPLVIAVVVLPLGMAALALGLWRIGAIPTWLAVTYGAAGGASLVLNAVLTQVAPVGVGLSGVGWAALGVHLFRGRGVRRTEPRALLSTRRLDPQVLGAGVAGLGLTALGLAGLPPLGPMSDLAVISRGTGVDAFDGLAIDLAHLLVGLGGLLVASRRDPRIARRFNRLGGAVFLLVGAVTVVETLTPGLLLPFNWRLVFVHGPVGALLAATGFSGRPRPRPAGETAEASPGG